jgi:hypothetical protein
MTGDGSDCPYCLAAQNPWPAIGKSLVFLNDTDVGEVGVVVKDVWGTCPSDRFLVRMAYETHPTALRMVMPAHDQYVAVESLRIPSWMPSLSIEDNARLHERFLLCRKALLSAQDRPSFAHTFASIVDLCWRHRLPLGGDEVWLVLEAHGIASRWRAEAIELFAFGVRLLTESSGRPAVKRKRMSPMSQGRYLTKAERELRLRIFGHC